MESSIQRSSFSIQRSVAVLPICIVPPAIFVLLSAWWSWRCPSSMAYLGYLQGDQPTYTALARAVFQRGNGLFYANPFDFDPSAPRVLTNLGYIALGWAMRALGQRSVLVWELWRIGFGATCYFLFAALVGRFFRSALMRWWVFLAGVFGGGAAWIVTLAAAATHPHNGLIACFVEAEKGYDWWCLNLFRQSIYPLELFYHTCFFAALLSYLDRRYCRLLAIVFALWWAHVVTAILATTIIGLALGVELLRRFVDCGSHAAALGQDAHENCRSAAGPAVVSCSTSTRDTGAPRLDRARRGPAFRRWPTFINFWVAQHAMKGSHVRTHGNLVGRRTPHEGLALVALAAVACVWIAYYGLFLPRLSSVRSWIEQTLSFEMNMTLSVWPRAWGLLLLGPVAALCYSPLRRYLLGDRTGRLVLLWGFAAFAWSHNNLVLSRPIQPMHFGRGYIYLFLLVLSAKAVEILFNRGDAEAVEKGLSPRSLRLCGVAFGLLPLLIADNALFVCRVATEMPQPGLLTISREAKQVLDHFRDQPASLRVVSMDRLLGVLIVAHTGHRVFVSEQVFTPFFSERALEAARMLQTGDAALLQRRGIERIILMKNNAIPWPEWVGDTNRLQVLLDNSSYTVGDVAKGRDQSLADQAGSAHPVSRLSPKQEALKK